MQNIAAKKGVRQEGVDSDYLFDNFLQLRAFRSTARPRNPSPLSAELPWRERCSFDPLGRRVTAEYFTKGTDAIFDVSEASGFWRVRPADRAPLRFEHLRLRRNRPAYYRERSSADLYRPRRECDS
jgi:hypothetical protein